MSKIDVIVSHPGGRGWGQIENLAILAATELDAELHRHTASSEYSRMHVARTLVPPRRDAKSDRVAIVIAPQPAHLNAILAAPHWRQQYRTVVGWVIDSFWTDRVPRVARSTSYYDHLFVMDPDDIEPWRTQIAATVSALPWGADVLGMPFSSERTMDLQRIGRQPDAWDDDNVTAAAAEALGLMFAGRPPSAATTRRRLRSRTVLPRTRNLSSRSRTVPTRAVTPTRHASTSPGDGSTRSQPEQAWRASHRARRSRMRCSGPARASSFLAWSCTRVSPSSRMRFPRGRRATLAATAASRSSASTGATA